MTEQLVFTELDCDVGQEVIVEETFVVSVLAGVNNVLEDTGLLSLTTVVVMMNIRVRVGCLSDVSERKCVDRLAKGSEWWKAELQSIKLTLVRQSKQRDL